MDRKKVGHAVIINNLDEEQIPTRKDVQAMGQVLKTIGIEVFAKKLVHFHFCFLQDLMFRFTRT